MLTACVFLCFQRYSVAVYLVRVFTAADLFSQLKLCSVESAERCRERSKCHLHPLSVVFLRIGTGVKKGTLAFTFYLMPQALVMCHDIFIPFSSRQTTIWSREWNCDHGPSSFSHLSSEYTFIITCFQMLAITRAGFYGLWCSDMWPLCPLNDLPTCLSCFCFPVGEDAARCAMSSSDLRPPSVFRRGLFPADEWEEAHMDLPRLWQACSFWAAHHWWVRSQRHALTTPSSSQ